MQPTAIERPARRVFAAIVSAACLHAALFAILAVLAAPSGSGGSGTGPGGASAYAASGAAIGAGMGAGTGSDDGSDDGSDEGSDEGNPIPVLVGGADKDSKNPEVSETPREMSPARLDDRVAHGDGGTFGDGDGIGGGTGDGSESGIGMGSGNGPGSGDGPGTGAGIGARQFFLGWLDDSIKARLSYPERARARNLEGTVVIALSVPADASACEATIAESSGVATLDRAAIALIHSLFPAPVAPGTPISTRFRIRYALSEQ